MDVAVLAAIVVLAAVASCIQSLSGFGFSLFIVPVLAVMIGPKETVFLANLLGTALNAVQMVHLRDSVEWRTSWLLLAGSFLGMPLGVAVLVVLDPAVLKIIIAVTVIVFTGLLIKGLRLHGGGTLGDALVGAVSGVFNTSTSMSGPPIVIYLQGKRLLPLEFRATNTFFFLVSGLGAVVFLSIGGASSRDVWAAAAIALPGVAIGRFAGNAWYRRIDAKLFRRIVYVVLLLSAAIALVTTLLV